MTLHRAMLTATLLCASATTSAAVAQTQPAVPQATARIGDLGASGLVIQGRVAEVFGNRLVLDDGSGRTLVEVGPRWYRPFEPRQGERLTVSGRPEDGGFEAFAIWREGGERVEIRRPAGPPPWAGGPGDRGREDRRDRRAERD